MHLFAWNINFIKQGVVSYEAIYYHCSFFNTKYYSFYHS